MVYDVNLTLTAGGPFKSTIMASMHVYNKAFKYNDYWNRTGGGDYFIFDCSGYLGDTGYDYKEQGG